MGKVLEQQTDGEGARGPDFERSNLDELETHGRGNGGEVAEDTFQTTVGGETYYLCRQLVEGKGNNYFFSKDSKRFDRVPLPDDYEVDGLKISIKSSVQAEAKPVSEKIDDYDLEHLKAVARLTRDEQLRGGVSPHLPDITRAVGHWNLLSGMTPTRQKLNELVQSGYLTKNSEGDCWELTEKGQEAVKGRL